jgi:hypothetical protein
VRNRKRHNFDVSHDETPSRLKELYALGTDFVPCRVFVIATPGSMGRSADVNREIELLGHHVQSADVVGMFVRDQDGIERFGSHANHHDAAAKFLTGESTVDEQTRARRDNDRAVALASARKDCE